MLLLFFCVFLKIKVSKNRKYILVKRHHTYYIYDEFFKVVSVTCSIYVLFCTGTIQD